VGHGRMGRSYSQADTILFKEVRHGLAHA
jgi:hypothetical protein